MKRENPQIAVDKWNATYPLGFPVRYWKGLREGVGKQSVTRSAASVLEGHTAVIWVHGVAGCIALTHIEPMPNPTSQPIQQATGIATPEPTRVPDSEHTKTPEPGEASR